MNEIRFNQFNKSSQNESIQTKQNDSSKYQRELPKKKNILRNLFLILIIISIAFAGVYFWKAKIYSVYHDTGASEYYAVFLTNGQVYFGKLSKKSKNETVLSDVYYLQASESTNTTQEQLIEPKFSLIKLGQEIHGPTNKLFINSNNILFYEQLKNDSRVVESIMGGKKQH